MQEKMSELKSIYRFPKVVLPVQSLRQILSNLLLGAMCGLLFEIIHAILDSSSFSINGFFFFAPVWGYVLIFIENPTSFTISSDQFENGDSAKMIDECLKSVGYEVDRRIEVGAIHVRYRKQSRNRVLRKIFQREEEDILIVLHKESIEVRGPLLTLHEFRKKLIKAPLRFTVPQP